MKQYVVFVIFALVAKTSLSQDPAPPLPPPMLQEESILSIVDEKAEFPGGTEAFDKFISENLHYPESAAEANISGKCYVKFIVSKTGEISNVTIVKKILNCPDCDKEAIRLVKSMPRWNPAKVKERAVHSYFVLPVEFKPGK